LTVSTCKSLQARPTLVAKISTGRPRSAAAPGAILGASVIATLTTITSSSQAAMAFGVWRLAFGVWRLAFGVWANDCLFGQWQVKRRERARVCYITNRDALDLSNRQDCCDASAAPSALKAFFTTYLGLADSAQAKISPALCASNRPHADTPNAKLPYSAHTVSPATMVLTARPFKFQPSNGVLRDRDKDSSFL
jgi:hypothetical protein